MPTKRHPRAPSKGKFTLHERIIQALIDADQRMCRNGFWQSVGEIVNAAKLDEDLVCREFRPDAYLIDHERQHINIVEVEVSCPLSDKKKDDYTWWWFLWEAECTDWEPRLFVVDRYGHGNELSLRNMYWAKVRREARVAA
jgi:hypothetical protein